MRVTLDSPALVRSQTLQGRVSFEKRGRIEAVAHSRRREDGVVGRGRAGDSGKGNDKERDVREHAGAGEKDVVGERTWRTWKEGKRGTRSHKVSITHGSTNEIVPNWPPRARHAVGQVPACDAATGVRNSDPRAPY